MRAKPGPGWQNIRGSVWVHEPTGVRIHLIGLVLGPDFDILTNQWPHSQKWSHHTRIAGGNQKRGLMTLALELAKGGA